MRFPAAVSALIIIGCFSGQLRAESSEPDSDRPGSKDLSWLKRFEGSKIVAYEQKAYDEYTFPSGPLARSTVPDAADESNNYVSEFKEKLSLEGARTRIVYLVPAGRSPLEVLRGYEQELVTQGAQKRFECATQACGGDAERNSEGGGGDQSIAMKLWPMSRVTDENFTNGSCAQAVRIADQRFGSFEIPGKAYVLVHTFIGKDTLYCKPFNDRVITIIDVLELKAREQKMVMVSAAEMSAALTQTGRIALYGILFDTASSVIKPESKAALDEIGKLLAQNPQMKLHVVGHTDNQGGLESNFALSKARAQAVSSALTSQYSIEAARLSANGVSYLAPVASNSDDAGRAKNRRVELVPF